MQNLVERDLKKATNAETLLGVTGSGKTFTMANVIAAVTINQLWYIAHNKTLAAQLIRRDEGDCSLRTQWNILSPTMIITSRRPTFRHPTLTLRRILLLNEEIDKLRLSATAALMRTERCNRNFASVSCIYGLGAPQENFEHDDGLIQPGNGEGPG